MALKSGLSWYVHCLAQQHKRAMQRLTELNNQKNPKGKGSRPTRHDAQSECVVMWGGLEKQTRKSRRSIENWKDQLYYLHWDIWCECYIGKGKNITRVYMGNFETAGQWLYLLMWPLYYQTSEVTDALHLYNSGGVWGRGNTVTKVQIGRAATHEHT